MLPKNSPSNLLKTKIHQKIIFGKNINLREIELKDAQFILNLRCDESKATFLNKTENNLEKQIQYIKNYKTKKQEWYFIIESKAKEQLGTIRIYDVVVDDFCWGSWLIKHGAPANAAIESVLLLYDYAFYTLGFNKAHFDVRKDNIKVRAFHKRFGAKEIDESDLDVFYTFSKKDYEKIKIKFIKFVV